LPGFAPVEEWTTRVWTCAAFCAASRRGFSSNRAVATETSLERLGAGDAVNLDITALTGRSPWLRMRVGDWRVIYRPADPGPGWYVAGVVNRRDRDATVKQL
jgi:hypothetical protein